MKTATRQWRIIGAVAAALTIATLATACSGTGGGASTSGSKPLVIRQVLANTSDPYWFSVGCQASKVAKKLGLDFKAYQSKGNDAAVLTTNFNAALLDQPDGVVIDAPTAQQFSAQIQAQQKKGIVFSQSVGITPPSYSTIVGDQDAPPAEISAAKAALDGGGSVMILGGSAAVPILADRYRLLSSELAKVSGVTVLPVEFSNFDAAKAQVDVNSTILAHPDLKLIVSSNGADTPGVLSALKQANRQDIKVIADDATPNVVAGIKDGTILGSQSVSVGQQATQEIGTLVTYLKAHPGKKPVTTTVQAKIGVGFLTKDNVDDPKFAEYLYLTTCN